MSSFIKDFSRIGLSKILIILFGLGTSILTARYLGPEKNGIIAALVVYPSLFITFGSLGVSQSVTFYIGKQIYPEDKIKTAITQIWLLSSSISLISCFLLIYFLGNDMQDKIRLIILAILPIPFTLFNSYNTGLFLGKNEIAKYNRINWIPTLLIFILSFILIYVFKFGIEGAMIATFGGGFLMSLILLFKNKFLKFFKLEIEWKLIKSLLSLGLIYSFSLLVINLNYKIDIIFMDKLSTPFELGIYSKGASLTQYLWQIPMLFSTLVFAKSAVSKNDIQFSHKVAQLLRLSLTFIGLICLILIFFSEFIITMMYGEAFRGSILVLQTLLPGVLLLTLFKVMNMDLAGKGKPWVSLKAMIPSLIINVIINIALVPKYGAYGAAVASTISYIIAALLFIYFYSVETKLTFKEIFAFKKSDYTPILNIVKKIKGK